MQQIEFSQPVYTFEIDSNQHVSNIVYVRWMEIARLQMLEAIGLPVHQIAQEGFVPVLTRTGINYRKPLFLGDTVTVRLWLTELKRLSATLAFGFYNQHGEQVATGEQQAVFVSRDSQRPYRLPEGYRMRFEAYLQTPGDPNTAAPISGCGSLNPAL